MFFKPIEKVLKARYEATEGARHLAEQSLAQAASKAEQFEKALFAARSEMYQAQEKAIKELHDRHAAAIATAHAEADAQVKKAKAQLAAEVANAKLTLSAESSALADRIAETILRRTAA